MDFNIRFLKIIKQKHLQVSFVFVGFLFVYLFIHPSQNFPCLASFQPLPPTLPKPLYLPSSHPPLIPFRCRWASPGCHSAKA